MKRLTEIVDLEKSQLENIKRVQNFLVAHPGYIKRGCGNIANKLGCTYDEVKQAKRTLKIDSVSLKDEVVEEFDKVYLPNILILDQEITTRQQEKKHERKRNHLNHKSTTDHKRI